MRGRDVKRTTTRTALGLYGSLLVLPTLIFGFLYYRELEKDFDRQRDEIPSRAKTGARLIIEGMKVRLERLLEAEKRRPFFQYAKLFLQDDELDDDFMVPQTSPMVRDEMPQGIQAWFSYAPWPDAPIEVFVGEATERRYGTVERLKPILEDLRRRQQEELSQGPSDLFEDTESEPVPLASVMVKFGYENDRDCLLACSQLIRGERINASVSGFRLQFYLDQEGTPRAIAVRRVTANPFLDDMPEDAVCLRPLVKGFNLYQGFLIDTTWLLKDLPWEIEERLLDEDMVLRVPFRGHPIDVSSVFEPIDPIRELEFETSDPQDASYSRLEVSINTDRIEARIQRQSNRFFTVALMLVVTLAIGMTLLYRSVRAELEQARRMQNFVAAVTHELRTPVSTIRLHAEMLLDGWASDPKKQREYYKRIVRETNRLSILVERVLEKSRIKENKKTPEPGDLNELVATLAEDLAHAPHDGEPGDDLVVELTPDLPPVWMTLEAITGILTNLVENARKYAPATTDEPILVRTGREGDRVVLEVLDRGPGVPTEEREKVFEAFYRVGSEATRTTTGTGLGLHLVGIHAETCRAKVAILDREGGGSVFQVAFEAAPAAALPAGVEAELAGKGA